MSCIWTFCNDYYMKGAKPYTHHLTGCGHKYKVIGRDWKYCPYCGDKIVSDKNKKVFLRGVEWDGK